MHNYNSYHQSETSEKIKNVAKVVGATVLGAAAFGGLGYAAMKDVEANRIQPTPIEDVTPGHEGIVGQNNKLEKPNHDQIRVTLPNGETTTLPGSGETSVSHNP